MTLFTYDPEKLSPELREQIEEEEEHKLYFTINHAGGVRHSLMERSSHPEREEHPLSVHDSLTAEEEMFQMQRHCIEQLKKLGVLENPTDEDGAPTEEYWKWFRRWHYHVESLPREEWEAFDKAMTAGKDVSKWYPEEEEDE